MNVNETEFNFLIQRFIQPCTCNKHVTGYARVDYPVLFEPYIAYCGTVWSSPHKNGNLDRTLRLQKRAVRISTHSSFLAHSASIFKTLNILTIYDLTHLSVLVYMLRATRNLLPHKFSSYLIHMDQIHSHLTRGSVNYVIPFARTTFRMASLQVMGPRLWNSLPTRVKQTQSICRPTLKKELKLIFFLSIKTHCFNQLHTKLWSTGC